MSRAIFLNEALEIPSLEEEKAIRMKCQKFLAENPDYELSNVKFGLTNTDIVNNTVTITLEFEQKKK